MSLFRLCSLVLTVMAFPMLANAENRIDLMRPDAPALAPYGTFKIGVRTIQVSNPGQIDILNTKAGTPPPIYDRPLTLEVWYPAKVDKPGGDYRILLRDGKTEVTVSGQAVRDAEPLKSDAKYPLIILSHGYPGNRFLMSHLGENLASKGYVTVAIDHTDSTYDNMAAFGSTLVNRPLDQKFVLNEIDRLGKTPGNFLDGIVDASNTGLVGYSMGGYGALITAGAGVTAQSVGYEWGAPAGTLAIHQEGTDSLKALKDDRFKAILAVAPWGMNTGFWDAKGLEGISVPMMFMAGSQDDVSGYENGTRAVFLGAVNTQRYLLTFDHANHNAAAPIPAPMESWNKVDNLDFIPFDHYADAVWDTNRMNNITQHFATAFFGKYLKADKEDGTYLELIEDSDAGVFSLDEAGKPKADHTYWKGFPARTAKGLRFEQLTAK